MIAYEKLKNMNEHLVFRAMFKTWTEVCAASYEMGDYFNFHLAKDDERVELMAWYKGAGDGNLKEVNVLGVNHINRVYIRHAMKLEEVEAILARQIRTVLLESIGI